MSAEPIWKFRRMQPGEMNIDPIEAEFFSTEALGSLADALVREAIQNSLDARIGGARLRVRFTFSTASGPGPAEQANGYLAGLWEHLRAARSGVTALPSPDEPLRFVAFEDFGTRGLQGEPAQTEDEEDNGGRRNDFYYFWRNIGRSQKQSTDLGRWGLGKTVFPAASRINSFFAVTVRADDKRRLLMGQSVLKIHKLGSERYYPYGYFGSFERDFALPVEESAFVDRFCRDFAIQRGGANGLSVVVPYPAADIGPQSVIPSVIGHYFVPILAGDLTVEVAFDGRVQVIDRSTLPGLLSAASWEHGPELRQVVDLAQWALAPSPEPRAKTALQPQASAPRWADHLDAEAAEALREAFNNGRRVAVTVPVWVKPAAGEPVASQFDVFLERDDEMTGAQEVFIRDGITVTGVRGSLQKGVRALVLVRDRALSQLLGDAENPAHTEWQERSPKFKEKYRHGPSVLRFVKHAPREIVRILTRPAEGRDFKLLQHLFSLDVPTEETLKDPKKGREDKKGTEDADPAAVQTMGKDKFFQLQKLYGGFRVSGNKDARGGPRYASVRVAYEVRRRNPFKQYQPPDFDLERPPIQVQTRNAEVLTRKLNAMTFRIDGADFEVTVKGFDPQRDLRVQVELRELEAA